jgi:hypothetical protein
MTPNRRAEIALELSDTVRSIAREGIRQRHPGYTPQDVSRALVRLLYGAEAARRVWPNIDAPVP